MSQRVILEGLIGCGKGSLLSYLENTSKVRCVEEPVSLWRNVAGTDLLKNCYVDTTNNNHFMLQSYILHTLAQLYMEEPSQQHHITFYERSIYSSFNVFTRHNWKNGLFTPTQFAILEQQFLFL